MKLTCLKRSAPYGLLSALILAPATAAQQGGWTDSFDTYAVGSLPLFPSSDWHYGGGNSAITVDGSSQPTHGAQSLRLYGQSGGCWASVTSRLLDPLGQGYLDDFTIQLRFRNGNQTNTGCHPERLSAELKTGPLWWEPSAYSLFSFSATGHLILVDGLSYGAAIPHMTWHHLGVRCRRLPTSQVEFQYQLDFQPLASITLPFNSNTLNAAWLTLASQEGDAWVDDLVVTPHHSTHGESRFTVIEQGCVGTNQRVPWLTAGSLPVLGSSMRLEIADAKALTVAFAFVGVVPIVVNLSPFGAPGCMVHTSNDSVSLTLVDATGSWNPRPAIAIPNSIGLLGLPLYAQAAVVDSAANSLQMVFSNAVRSVVGGRVDAVQVEANSMWNSKVYMSWQNIRHVYQSNSLNMVVDTLKYDDNGNGDPRDDANRIIWKAPIPVNDNAVGIGLYASFADAELDGANPGVVTPHASGAATLTLRRNNAAGSYCEARYTMMPSESDIWVEAEVVGSTYANWGIVMRNDVWVNSNPGAMLQYDIATLNGTPAVASSTYGYGPHTQGQDYWTIGNISHGYVGVGSTANNSSLGVGLEWSEAPMILECHLGMRSQNGGWPFIRAAVIAKSPLPNNQFRFRAIVHGEAAPSFSGLQEASRVNNR